MSKSVLTELKGDIAILTLNRPEKLNAWDTPMRAEVAAQLRGARLAGDLLHRSSCGDCHRLNSRRTTR